MAGPTDIISSGVFGLAAQRTNMEEYYRRKQVEYFEECARRQMADNLNAGIGAAGARLQMEMYASAHLGEALRQQAPSPGLVLLCSIT